MFAMKCVAVWGMIVAVSTCLIATAADDDRSFPVQKVPKSVVRIRPSGDLAQQMLIQSVSGLSAKAVNRGTGDEMVCVATDNTNLEAWYQTFLKQHPAIETSDVQTCWELVDRFVKLGTIKGYILYSLDKSEGNTSDHRKGMDLSANVATSLAGVLDGVLIADSLEEEAKSRGLSKLLDVRGKTQAWCFETYKDKLNRQLLCHQDPRVSNVRDLAIAHQALVVFGADKTVESSLKWLEPLSPIVGWNGGDEFKTTRLASIYGHIRTPSDWCVNLPVLMAGSASDPAVKEAPFDLQTIDWNDRRSCVSFVLSDGDNLQWYQTTFFQGNPHYWNNPDRGKIPFGWSCCFADLAQLCPAAIDYAIKTQQPNDRFIEWGAGYYYPDLFGQSRPNRPELMSRQARRSWKQMRQTGTRIIAFIVAAADSADALKAYKMIARETDDLSAILAIQYSPYEGGEGKTFWVKDRRNVEIPVVTARYSIWEHTNARPRTGTPAKVAREIRESCAGKTPHYDWVSVHAWSYFKRIAGNDETAEDMPQTNAEAQGGIRGYTAALSCAERLPVDVRVVTPDELVWRIRMKHDAAATSRLLEEMKSK